MKKYIFLTLVLIYFSCKEKRNSSKKGIPKYYNSILKEIEAIDTSKYFVTYSIVKNLDTLSEFKNILNRQKLQDNSIIPIIESNLHLSKKIKDIIINSSINKENKMELTYYFSYPYQIKDSIILIFNELLFKKGNYIKGGGTRVFFLKKKKKQYIILNKKQLTEY